MHYTVEHGDNLLKIAEKFYGDHSKWRFIFDANPDVIVLLPGTVLFLPPLNENTKKRIDTNGNYGSMYSKLHMKCIFNKNKYYLIVFNMI